MSSDPSHYQTFSIWTLITLVVGNAVGAGIYTTSGFALADLGSREWVLMAWVVAGLLAMCGALSYGMLVRGVTESGGEFLFLTRSIHPIAGFIAAWISLLAGFTGAIAFSASALEVYARQSMPLLSILPTNSIAVGAIIVAGFSHYSTVKQGAQRHKNLVNVMLLVLLVIILVSAFLYWTKETLPVQGVTQISEFNAFAFANTLVWVSLSYSGFNAAAYVAGEVKNGYSLVPKAMLIGTFLTLLLCVLLNAIMLYSADFSILSGQADIAVIAAQSLGGPVAAYSIQLVIVISLLTSITAMSLAGPRVYAKMAEEGMLPKRFKVRPGEPPRNAIVLQMLVSLVLVLVADLRDLLSYLGLALSLCLALAVSSIFVRHARFAERPDSIFYPIAPLLFVVCTVFFAVLSAYNDITQLYAVAAVVFTGVVAYAVSQWLKIQ